MADIESPSGNPFETSNSSGELPPQVVEYVEDFAAELTAGVLPLLGEWHRVYIAAETTVREEHPEYFIEYKQPRTPKEKLKLRQKQRKIRSRAKKLHYAMEAKMAELGGNPLSRDNLLEAVMGRTVIMGIASQESEIAYLEKGFGIESES